MDLLKDGFSYEKWENNECTRIPICFNMEFFKYWEHTLDEVDLTLLDLVNIIKSDPKALKFLEFVTNSFITNYISELNDEDIDTEYEQIAIKRSVAIMKTKKHNDLQDVTCCSGLIKNEYCALEFTNWNELKNVPIKIYDKLDITLYSNGKSEELGEFDNDITISDFFISIFNELCFFESPAKRDESMSGLQDTIDKLEKGEIETYSWDGWKEDLDEE